MYSRTILLCVLIYYFRMACVGRIRLLFSVNVHVVLEFEAERLAELLFLIRARSWKVTSNFRLWDKRDPYFKLRQVLYSFKF